MTVRQKPSSTLLLAVRAGPGRTPQLQKRLSPLSLSSSRRSPCSSNYNPRRSTRSSIKAQAQQGRKPWLLPHNPATASDNPNGFGTAYNNNNLTTMRIQANLRRHPEWILFHSASSSPSHHGHFLIMPCLFPSSSSPSPPLPPNLGLSSPSPSPSFSCLMKNTVCVRKFALNIHLLSNTDKYLHNIRSAGKEAFTALTPLD